MLLGKKMARMTGGHCCSGESCVELQPLGDLEKPEMRDERRVSPC